MGSAVLGVLEHYPRVSKLNCRLEEIKPRSIDCDIIIHCAGALRHHTCDLKKSNIDGMRSLLKGLKSRCKVVYISSKSVYAAHYDKKLTEEDLVEPFDAYGSSKLLAEKILLASGFPYLILRSGTLFGISGRNPGISFPFRAIRNFYENREVLLYEPDVLCDYLYVSDLACLIKTLIFSEAYWNDIYNIAGPHRSLHQLIFVIAEHIKKTVQNAPIIRIIEKNIPWINRLDCSKLEKKYGKIHYSDDKTVVSQLFDFYRESLNK